MNSQLNILVLSSHFAPEPTGNAPYATGMAVGLAAKGHRVSVITTFPHYPQWRIAEGYGGWTVRERVRGIPATRVRHFVPRSPVGWRRGLAEVSFGVRALSSRWLQPDVVICYSPALLATALSLPRAKRRCAVGVVVQDLYSAGVEEQVSAGVLGRFFSWIEAAVIDQADGVAVIHERFRKRLVDRLGAEPERVSVIRNWTHLPEVGEIDRDATRGSLGWRDDETVVLHSGAMGQKQDLANVVEAARLADEQGLPVRFVLMGDGGQRRSLEELGAGVRSLQFVDPLPGDDYGKALRSADVLLVNEKAGLKEMAVPSKLTSYFSTGLPVLAATGADSTTADEIRAAEAGVLVRPGDPQALLDGARDLGHDPERAREIGARGPAYCERVLSETAAIDAYDRWVWDLYARRWHAVGSAKGIS